MSVIGLTGGIGCGKSLVAEYFSRLGARVVDADQLARLAIKKPSPGFDAVVKAFGDSILKGGDIDRMALGDLIFKDPSKREVLESIVHPEIRKLFAQAIADLTPGEVLIYEIPLLVETNAESNFDYIITVESNLDIRRKRLHDRGMSDDEIDRRIAAQATPDQRREIADAIIENNGDEDQLLRAVENLWEDVLTGLK